MFFILNLILVAIWVALTGDPSFGNIVFAAVVSFLLIGLTQHTFKVEPLKTSRNYIRKVGYTLYFAGFFINELVLASVNVLVSILSPLDRLKPGVIAVPLDLESDAEITLLANLITLTPGTLSLDVSTDKKFIYIHSIHVDDPKTFRTNIKNGFEKRVKEVMR